MESAKVVEGFLACAAPCSVQIFGRAEAYKTDEEYVYAVEIGRAHV